MKILNKRAKRQQDVEKFAPAQAQTLNKRQKTQVQGKATALVLSSVDKMQKRWYTFAVRDSRTVAWGNSRGKSEHHRARVQDNVLWRRLQGKCNRNIPQLRL